MFENNLDNKSRHKRHLQSMSLLNGDNSKKKRLKNLIAEDQDLNTRNEVIMDKKN